MKRKPLALLAVTVIATGFACGAGHTAEQKSKTPPPLPSGTPTTSASAPPKPDRAKEIEKLAAQAYVFGYPALFMERQERTMTTNVRLPLGTFAHASKPPRPEDADVLPSRDTLLSSAWLELHDGAWTLKLPDMGNRWFAIQMFDAYGEPIGVVESSKATVAIEGPGFAGAAPPGATEIKSTTSTVWILGRTRVLADTDTPRVAALLKKWQLAPLPPTVAPKDLPPPPLGRPQDLKFGGPEIFDELGEIWKTQPPPKDVTDALAQEAHLTLQDFATAGIGPGLRPSTTLSPELVASVAQGIKDGAEEVDQRLEKLATRENGWDVDRSFGARGAAPLTQAAWVLRGLDWPFAKDGIVFIGRVDESNRVLSGAHEYVIHLDKTPARAFYSVTMYSGRTAALLPGAKRWSVDGSTLKKNSDGSVDVALRADAAPPKTPDSNWLPAPKNEAFMVALRLHDPDPAASSWSPPAIKRIQ
ncbi:MAG TPA: DUF1254 domain-containing protein [Polyangiaceae bacterium]|jgi:hypothetical protein